MNNTILTVSNENGTFDRSNKHSAIFAFINVDSGRIVKQINCTVFKEANIKGVTINLTRKLG